MRPLILLSGLLLSILPCLADGPGLPGTPNTLYPNTHDNLQRPLRYTPRGTDFAITNGSESFNRPLYGGGTAFRVDAGDRPVFGLYLPGRGGVLRFGWHTAAGSRWAHEAADIVAVYRPGGYTYELRDPSLGSATVHLRVLALHETEGLVLEASLSAPVPGCEFLWTLGGANGDKGRRSVDLGTESMPVAQWWQFRPEHAQGNSAVVAGASFTLSSKVGTLHALASSAKASHLVLDAADWPQPPAALVLRSGANTTSPLVLGRAPASSGAPLLLAIELRRPASVDKPATPAPLWDNSPDTPSGRSLLPDAPPADNTPLLRRLLETAEARRAQLASRLSVDTPDPFLNASVAALNIAGDGVWDEPSGTVQHGAVAWRSKLLGWRGPYLNDALGWHDRARSHIRYWSGRQNRSPIPAAFPAPDAKDNLARNEPALHSNGDLSGTHYDMNLVYIDALFRHLLWTGDLELGRQLWPLIEAHLAWERRLFRRPYGPDSLPLYEAYCAIWASDDLWYSGGGTTHTTAYNYWHNRMAARLASQLGRDPAPYTREADLIRQALRTELWLSPEGRYAESREWLGARLPRTHPALWTFYHAVDSDAATPLEAWQMLRYIDTEIAHFPLTGPGLPTDGAYTLPTTNWLPYAWSTNNVVMSEVAHTALGFWQSGRRDEAWRLLKGALLDSMWTGLCPGNAGMCTSFDVNRRESQRDFADSVGTSARAIVEGLFGVRPDALAGELTLRPGLPASWPRAALRHVSLDFEYTRDGLRETYRATPHFPAPQRLRLQVPALRDTVASVTVNGTPAAWTCLADSIGEPRIEILAPAAPAQEVVITWSGRAPLAPEAPVQAQPTSATHRASPLPKASDKASTTIAPASAHSSHPSKASPFPPGASLQVPVPAPATLLSVEDPQGALAAHSLTGSLLEATLAPVPPRVTAHSNLPVAHRTVFLRIRQGSLEWTAPVFLDIATPPALPPPIDWSAPLPAGARPEPVSLEKHYNRRLADLFSEDYLSPRSPFVSLAIPRHGYGSWCTPLKTFAIDDSGLRSLASRPAPLGIPFATPSAPGVPNAAVTSLWDNHPRELVIPLSGRASRILFLVTGSGNSMQSRLDTAELVVTYADGGTAVLPLRNPANWWPIDQDLFIDDYAFASPAPVPPRLDLATGRLRLPSEYRPTGKLIRGGAASLLGLDLDPSRELRSLTVRPLANEVLVALLSTTLLR